MNPLGTSSGSLSAPGISEAIMKPDKFQDALCKLYNAKLNLQCLFANKKVFNQYYPELFRVTEAINEAIGYVIEAHEEMEKMTHSRA